MTTTTDQRIEWINADADTAAAETETGLPPSLRLVQLGFATMGRVFPNAAARAAYRLFSTPRVRARHKSSDAVLESARLFEVLYGGQILKAYEWGNGPRTVLLIHGWESRGTALRSFVPRLVAAGYRVVAFDGPAHGNSGGKQTTMVHFAGAIKAMLLHCGPVEAVIAHSFGGASTVFALAYVDNTIELPRLVLVGVPASTQRVFQSFLRTIHAPGVVGDRLKTLIEDRIHMALEDTDLVKAYPRAHIGSTLIVHDADDSVVPFANAEWMLESIPGARLIVTRGLGHYRLMKHPEVVRKVVDFITIPG